MTKNPNCPFPHTHVILDSSALIRLLSSPTWVLIKLNPQGLPSNNWRSCSLQQVELLKCLAGIVPVWSTGIHCFLVMDQQSTFGVLQAMQMKRTIGHNFTIPPAWMGITSMIALSIWIFIYEHVYIPNIKKILKRDSRLTLQQRIKIGIIMSILCMLVEGIIEKKHRNSALKQGSFVSPECRFHNLGYWV